MNGEDEKIDPKQAYEGIQRSVLVAERETLGFLDRTTEAGMPDEEMLAALAFMFISVLSAGARDGDERHAVETFVANVLPKFIDAFMDCIEPHVAEAKS